MHWQQIILGLGQIVFVIALIPSLVSNQKPEIWTSIITGLVALSITITYFSMSLIFAAISASVNFIIWSILAIQRYRQIKNIKVKS